MRECAIKPARVSFLPFHQPLRTQLRPYLLPIIIISISMGSLDEHGKIAVGLLIVYPFVFLLSFILVIRHGFSKQKGWLFLLTFSLGLIYYRSRLYCYSYINKYSAKIVGSALLIIAENRSNPSTNLLITAYAIEGAGIAPLLQCTMSLLSAA